LFAKRTQSVSEAIPELYLHGLAEGDFDLALRGLLGDKAPLSASTVARLKQRWKGELETWKSRDLSRLEPVYIWVDGLYVKAGLEKTKAALLVVLAALSDGTKVVLSVTPGYRESTESWSSVLRDLQSRGLRAPRLLIADGHLGIWGALRNIWPEVDEQRCWNHRIQNVLDRIPKNRQVEAKEMLRKLVYAKTEAKAVKARELFGKWCRLQGFEAAGQLLLEDWDRMVAFYSYPKEHWQHLRTTNPVESPFAAVRLRTNAAKRYKKVENATVVIWKMLLVAEKRFRRLRSPHLCIEVAAGAKYNDGIKKIERAAA
jgi:transposase-like protein